MATPAEKGTDGIIERSEEMNDFKLGDQIEIVFADAPGGSARATVSRFLSDQQEGLSADEQAFGREPELRDEDKRALIDVLKTF